MDTKKITEEMKAKLDAPLPAEAIKPHPTKSYLSTINAIYVTERLNDVFGVGSWRIRSEGISKKTSTVTTRNGPKANTMVVTKTIFEIPEYGIYYECYGGNDNDDLGDAYKGSTTDALTKIGSYLGIGADVWKDKSQRQPTTQNPCQQPQRQPRINTAQRKAKVIDYLQHLDDVTFVRFQNYFRFDKLECLTDAQINAIADYLNAQKK